MSSDEQLLLGRTQAGDKKSLEMLWDVITPKLFGYLINTVRDKALAEDILQTTWMKALEALPRFRDRGSGISPWLFAIARNECRQYWRKHTQEIPFDPLHHDVPHQEHYKTEAAVLVEQTLNALSEDDRDILRLRYIADLSPAEISGVTGINSIAIRVRIHRALKRARNLLH